MMVRLKRKGGRDRIRYRLHTSIQAAAWIADDPGPEDIDHELIQIMSRALTGSRPP